MLKYYIDMFTWIDKYAFKVRLSTSISHMHQYSSYIARELKFNAQLVKHKYSQVN